VNLLGRKKAKPDSGNGAASAASDDATGQEITPSRTTAPKGRPTPKRSEAARKRGPVAPAPLTAAEARRRRKEMGGPKLSREERKAEKLSRRSDMADRRAKMMAGEDAYLLPRDKGPVRRFVRDVVDSRRNVLVLVLVMVIDGFLVGRKANKLVDQKFPDNTESGWKLGFYAASRASQLRRMRAPRPQVDRGDKIA
jgi:hypothetical protein